MTTINNKNREFSEILIQDETLFQTIFNIASIGMVVIDPDNGRFLTVNDKYCEITGYSHFELSTMVVFELTHPDDRAVDRALYEQAMCGELPQYRNDKRYLHRNGQTVWVRVNTAFLRNISGQAIRSIGMVEDITQQKQAETALRESEERFRAFMDNSPCIAWIKDDLGCYVYLNKTYEQRFSVNLEDWRGKTDFDVWPLPTAQLFRSNDLTVLNSGQTLEIIKTLHNPDGSCSHWHNARFLIIDGIGRKYIAGIGTDISQQIEANEQLRLTRDKLKQRGKALLEAYIRLEHTATHDALTKLINRNEFELRLGRILANTGLDQVHTLLYLDLDQFKVVNDTCGRRAGDVLLRQLAAVLGAYIRQRDTLARLGGDEFGILMEHCPLERGLQIAETLLQAVQDFQFLWEDKRFRVGASIGLVAFSKADGSLNDILSMADRACYIAKDKGRHRVHIYTPNDSDLSQQAGEMHWIPRLQQALAQDQFLLYAQPVIALGDHKGTQVEYEELLIRLATGQDESLLPGAFIPPAERYHQITALDRWVLRTTLTTIARSGYRGCYGINISGQSLGDGKFLEYVFKQLELSGIPPGQLCFEITETAAITDLKHALAFITILKKHGCRFALDDFGSGLASFAYLKTLPVDYLKIDGRFIKDIPNDAVDLAMVESICQVAQAIGIKTIAESVETVAIQDRIRAIGIDFGQGYALARPQALGSTSSKG